MSYEKWAGFCTKIVTKIRENEHYDSLRVSYLAFYTVPVDGKCVIQTLSFLTPLPDGNDTVKQQMMSCFGREAIVSARESIDQNNYYNELAFYPSNEKTMMVFKYDKVSEVFILLETYEEENWLQTKEVPNDLLTLPPPTYIEKQELAKVLKENEKILEKARFVLISHFNLFLNSVCNQFTSS